MRASKVADEIGVVVHGPEVVDLGFAEMAIDRLSDLGTVTAVLGGTMGRVAVIDGSLEDRINISRRELRPPPQLCQDEGDGPGLRCDGGGEGEAG